MKDTAVFPSVSVDPSGEHQEESSKMCDASRDISKEVPCRQLYQISSHCFLHWIVLNSVVNIKRRVQRCATQAEI